MENYYLVKLHGKKVMANLRDAGTGTGTGTYAKISLDKIDIVEKHKWYLGKDGYPFAYIRGARVPLHRYIWYKNKGVWRNIGESGKLYVDHVNRDKLDARDENLRLATPAENSYNRSSNASNTTIDPYTMKPLHHIKLLKSGYEVKIGKNGVIHKISQIKTLEEAKNIYNMMATELFGEYAVLYET